MGNTDGVLVISSDSLVEYEGNEMPITDLADIIERKFNRNLVQDGSSYKIAVDDAIDAVNICEFLNKVSNIKIQAI